MNKEFDTEDRTKKESKFGKWHVSKNGNMNYNEGYYEINETQLTEHD